MVACTLPIFRYLDSDLFYPPSLFFLEAPGSTQQKWRNFRACHSKYSRLDSCGLITKFGTERRRLQHFAHCVRHSVFCFSSAVRVASSLAFRARVTLAYFGFSLPIFLASLSRALMDSAASSCESHHSDSSHNDHSGFWSSA